MRPLVMGNIYGLMVTPSDQRCYHLTTHQGVDLEVLHWNADINLFLRALEVHVQNEG